MSNCPRCGGGDALEVAPGFRECVSIIVEEHAVLMPDPADLRLMRPMPQRVDRRCGHRYQVGGSASGGQLCACGTFAIGRCIDCETFVCGDHSALQDGGRRCADHHAVARAVAREAAEAAKRQEEALPSRTVVAFLKAMTDAGDPGTIELWAERHSPYSRVEERRLSKAYKADRTRGILGKGRGPTKSQVLAEIRAKRISGAPADCRGWVVLTETSRPESSGNPWADSYSSPTTTTLLLLNTGEWKVSSQAPDDPCAMVGASLSLDNIWSLGAVRSQWGDIGGHAGGVLIGRLHDLVRDHGLTLALPEAEAWYRRVADQDFAFAMKSLEALCRDRGDLVEAQAWHERAARADR